MTAATQVLVLAASKGGVGKTTLSLSLAVRAVQKGKRIAMIDRDPQESLAAWFDRRGYRTNPHLIEIDSTPEAVGLATAGHSYDYAIIDTPPSQMGIIADAISLATFVLIPCGTSAMDLAALPPVIEICLDFEKPYALVLNRVQPRRKLTRTTPPVLRELYGNLCETMIEDRTAYQAAATVGKGPTEVDRDKMVTNEIDRLWGELEVMMRVKRAA